jgi:alpha-1,6-mannosyltransferase
MATSTSAQAPKTGPAHHLWRLTSFAASPQGRPALLGALGAVLITAGGLGAGSTRLHDPLLESLHLSWLRFGHGLVLSSVLLWVGVALMLIAWLWLGRWVIDRTATEFTMVATTGFWLAPLLLSVPCSVATPTPTWRRARCYATASTRMSSGPSITRTPCWTT